MTSAAAGIGETSLALDLGDSTPRSAPIARGTAAWDDAMLKALGQTHESDTPGAYLR
jgi:hypothetical protein